MPDLTVMPAMSRIRQQADEGFVYPDDRVGQTPGHQPRYITIQRDRVTGPRLKFYSRVADVHYWTELWRNTANVPYDRALSGHMPHQLRDTFRRWVEPGARTLEAGCGLGQFTVAASSLGYRAEGLDWSAQIIERLQRRFPGIPWHVGDARHLQFPDGTFDAVFSPGVCEHFEDGPTAVLVETHRVLRPGGIAVISTPCFNAWLQRHAAHLPGRAERPAAFYQYAFTPAGMARLLGQLGFEVLQIRPYGALDTLVRYGGLRVPARWRDMLAIPFEYLPVVRNWGSTCIWVARKCRPAPIATDRAVMTSCA